MRVLIAIAVIVFCLTGQAFAQENLVIKASPHSVAATIDKLSMIMKKKGITVFARIDHAAGAMKIDAKLRPTQLLIFAIQSLEPPCCRAISKLVLHCP